MDKNVKKNYTAHMSCHAHAVQQHSNQPY